MAKLYFGDTNGGYITIAVDEESGRSCYMWEEGHEGINYPSRYDLQDMTDEERENICKRWLAVIATYNDFDGLYTDCDVDSGYVGIIPSGEDPLCGIDVFAELDF